MAQHETDEFLYLALARWRVRRERHDSAQRDGQLGIVATRGVQHVLNLLEDAQELGRVLDTGHVSVQCDKGAPAGELGLIVLDALGMPLDRVPARAHRNLERLLLIGALGPTTTSGAASGPATRRATVSARGTSRAATLAAATTWRSPLAAA